MHCVPINCTALTTPGTSGERRLCRCPGGSPFFHVLTPLVRSSSQSVGSGAVSFIHSAQLRDHSRGLPGEVRSYRHTLQHSASIENDRHVVFRPRAVLELGAGLTGLLGLGLWAWDCCASVQITDGHPSCAKNLQVCSLLNKELGGPQTCTLQTSQLQWAAGDPSKHLELLLHSLQSRSGQADRKFDRVVSADCLFFTDFHVDLLWIIDHALSVDGRCYMLQPRRSNTMQKFIDLVVQTGTFSVEVLEDYCPEISAMNQKYIRENAENDTHNYDIDIHYPILVILQKLQF